MFLWRLSTLRYANVFDGGYGLENDGRWNSQGIAITYTSTSTALCVLEKLVHIEDPTLLPDLVMVRYSVPAEVPIEGIELGQLPPDWQADEGHTQQIGTNWLNARTGALLQVPSAIVAFDGAPDRNVIINHAHPLSRLIAPDRFDPFIFDRRLV